MRNMRYFIIIAVLLFAVVGYKTYEQYTIMENTRQDILRGKGESFSAFLAAFRETYQKAFLEHHIPVDDQTLPLLPVVTTGALSKNLSRKLNGDVQIRTVSDRPRNSINQADPFEKEMIENQKANMMHLWAWFREIPFIQLLSAPIVYMMVLPAILLDIMYELPELEGYEVVITPDVVEKKAQPLYLKQKKSA